MDATWQWLGNAAGTRSVGVNRVRVEPGKLPTPPHSHGASEELYFVFAGSGLAWQDGQAHEVRPLDCVIHRPDEMEHTFVAGPEGLEYLVFGTRHPTELGWLPRSRAIRLGWPWVEGRDDDPWEVEATVEPLAVDEPSPRPANIVNVDEVEHEKHEDLVTTAPLATRERSTLAGLNWEKIAAGHRGCGRTATPPRRRSSSSWRARRPSSCGPAKARSRRRLCEPDTSSPVRPPPASPTPSAPGRTA